MILELIKTLVLAQESSGKQGVLGPTKIYLAVQPSQSQPQPQPPPLAPVQSPMQQVSVFLNLSNFF